MNLKKILFIIIFIFCYYPIFAAEKNIDDTNIIPSYKKTKELRAVVLTDFPPLYILDQNRKPAGLAIDILEYIAKNLGYKIKYKVVENWDEMLKSLEANEADLAPGVGITADRLANFKVSETFVEVVPVSCFVRASNYDIHGIPDLVNRRTGVIENGGAYNEMKNWENYNLITFKNIDSALFALLAGQIDAFVFPEPVLLKKIREVKLENRIKIVGKPLMELKRGYVFNKNDDYLHKIFDEELKKVVNSEFYHNIYLKWYGEPPEFWNVKKVVITCVIIIIVIVIVLFVWKYKTTRKLYLALKNTEKQYYELVNNMTEIVAQHKLVFDNNGAAIDYEIIDANLAFYKTLNLTPENVIGRRATEVYKTAEPPFFDIYKEVALTGKATNFEIYYEPIEKYFLISTFSPKKNYFVTVTTDITLAKKNEKLLNDLVEQLQNKTEEMENILYISSHDLRSPLLNIQGFTDRISKKINEIFAVLDSAETLDDLKNKITDEHKKQINSSFNFIQISAKKMDVLISGLLKLSRLGRLIPQMNNIDMNALLEEIIKNLAIKIQEYNVKIKIEDLPNCIGDRNLLNQVFTNLIDNAIKYRKMDTQLVLNISGKIENEYIVYCVKDNGIGISKNNIEKIWKLFYRITDNNDIDGEGIGLTIVKNIIQKHSGKVWVKSEYGNGSEFYIALPKLKK
ncbi:MAG TPA: transporter substrate-binding domain-containing protein [bacterium]|nr:transporter substrate-binding domain-containing protein [bacterium]